MAELLQNIEDIWMQVKRHLIPLNSGCIVTDYAPVKKTGYVQVRYKGKKHYVHIIAAMRRCGRAPEEGEEASHICNNPACVNPTHLTLETGEINKSRICCKIFNKTPGYKCPHNPPCFDIPSLH